MDEADDFNGTFSIPDEAGTHTDVDIDMFHGNTTTSVQENVIGHVIVRSCFLILFILSALVGNILYIVSITANRALRKNVYNIITLNCAVLNLIDCLLNMTIALGSTIKEEWIYGSGMCRFNSFMLQVVTFERATLWVLLGLDRYLAMHFKVRYKEYVNRLKVFLLLGVAWMYCVVMSIPILTGSIHSSVNPAKYLCSVSKSTSLAYTAITFVLCCIVPIGLCFAFFILMAKMIIAEKIRSRILQSLQNYNRDDRIRYNPELDEEIGLATLSGIILGIWILLEGPFVVLSYILQFRSSLGEINSDIIWEMNHPSVLETIFTWARFAYSGIFPLMLFIFRKDILQNLKDVMWCQPTAVSAIKPPGQELVMKTVNRIAKRRHYRRKPRKVRPYVPRDIGKRPRAHAHSPNRLQVPVLFATAKGIHVQRFESQSPVVGLDDYHSSSKLAKEAAASGTSPMETCDVYGYHYPEFVIMPETSEYPYSDDDYDNSSDSEEITDRLSLSHPITSGERVSADFNGIALQRCCSNPELELCHHKPSTLNTTPISQGDSGIDVTFQRSFKGENKINYQKSVHALPDVETSPRIRILGLVTDELPILNSVQVSIRYSSHVENGTLLQKEYITDDLTLCDSETNIPSIGDGTHVHDLCSGKNTKHTSESTDSLLLQKDKDVRANYVITNSILVSDREDDIFKELDYKPPRRNFTL